MTVAGGQGRGYITTKNGHDWVVTAAHVVGGNQQVQVEGKTFRVHSRHPNKDVAFIYIGPAPYNTDGWHYECLGRKTAEPIVLDPGYYINNRGLRGGCPVRNTHTILLTGKGNRSYLGQSGSPVITPMADALIGILVCGDSDSSVLMPYGEYADLIPDRP